MAIHALVSLQLQELAGQFCTRCFIVVVFIPIIITIPISYPSHYTPSPTPSIFVFIPTR